MYFIYDLKIFYKKLHSRKKLFKMHLLLKIQKIRIIECNKTASRYIILNGYMTKKKKYM